MEYTPWHSKYINSLSISSTLRRSKQNDSIDGISQAASSMQIWNSTVRNSNIQVSINLEIHSDPTILLELSNPIEWLDILTAVWKIAA